MEFKQSRLQPEATDLDALATNAKQQNKVEGFYLSHFACLLLAYRCASSSYSGMFETYRCAAGA
jgi:hypothetical protein